MQEKVNNILVAPLNWGLGHATRCIPIIRELIANDFTPILASDGKALLLLKKEFPDLLALEVPSYDIKYPVEGANFKWKMLRSAPKIFDAIKAERKLVKKWVAQYNLKGIISDNRFGIISKKVPSVFMTHQLNVLSGNTTWISSKLHQNIIEKFTECWVPDFAEKPTLSGKLGHRKNELENVNYIGPLSRFEKKDLPKQYDLLVLLSGPEPQRTLFEEILRDELSKYSKKAVFVLGKVEEKQIIQRDGNLTIYNFMDSQQLETTITESDAVLCRSGYSTIMDLSKLGKKCYFIPTPGQYEQEYLAQRFTRKKLVPSCSQDEFTLDKLEEMESFSGIPQYESKLHWKNLFCLFERE